jgi:methyl-accepting chemotaxis protein
MTTDRLDSIDEKLELLVDQVGRLTEGLPEFRMDMAEIKDMIRQQAEVSIRQSENIDRLSADIAELKDVVQQQAETAKQQAETAARLSRIVEQLLQERSN